MQNLRLGLVVGRNETWTFVRDLYEDWQRHYRVDVFEERPTRSPFFRERLNRRGLERDLTRFLATHDVVFFEWATDLLVVASRLPRSTRIITRLHSYELFEYAPRVEWSHVDRIILVSEAMRRRFCALYPEAAPRTAVIHNGVDLDRFKPRGRKAERTIGMLCNLVPIKRVYEVILELHELRQAGQPFHLRIGGAPKPGADNQRYHSSILRLIERLELSDCVSIDGFIDKPEVFLGEIEVFVSNSFWEGQQVALLEAMASGCYCLSHDWEGADEALPPANRYRTGGELREKLVSFAQRSLIEREALQSDMRTIAEREFSFGDTKQRVKLLLEGLVGV